MPRLSGQITVAAVGKLHRPYWKLALKEYERRLQRYTNLTLIEVKDMVGSGLPDKVALEKEGEQLLKAAASANRTFALTPIGVQRSSPQLAKFLERQIQLFGSIAFLIGGPMGITDNVLADCHDQISLSTLTFPHELARVMFMEQLYRAATIINNEKYHK